MSDKSTKIDGHDYRVARMPVMDQYDVARKWSPLLVWVSSREPGAPPLNPEGFARGFCAVSTSVPKGDSDLAIQACLRAVSRITPGGGAVVPVLGETGQIRFDDIDLGPMLQLVFHVLDHNGIIAFFSAPPMTAGGGA